MVAHTIQYHSNVHAQSLSGKGRQLNMSSSEQPSTLYNQSALKKNLVSFYVTTIVALSLQTEVHIRVITLRQGRRSRAFLVTPPR